MYSFVKCCQIVGFVKPLIELLWTPMYNLLYILCSTCKRRLSTSIFHSVPRQSVHVVQYGMRISSNVLTSPLCWQTSLYCLHSPLQLNHNSADCRTVKYTSAKRASLNGLCIVYLDACIRKYAIPFIFNAYFNISLIL